ncbi:hypothetical protein C0995_001047 [Termitomyces sp. Mi166|nr:hypothetical protein C0995_001047 [Termitomyces sp. Mi166\
MKDKIKSHGDLAALSKSKLLHLQESLQSAWQMTEEKNIQLKRMRCKVNKTCLEKESLQEMLAARESSLDAFEATVKVEEGQALKELKEKEIKLFSLTITLQEAKDKINDRVIKELGEKTDELESATITLDGLQQQMNILHKINDEANKAMKEKDNELQRTTTALDTALKEAQDEVLAIQMMLHTKDEEKKYGLNHGTSNTDNDADTNHIHNDGACLAHNDLLGGDSSDSEDGDDEYDGYDSYSDW